MDMIETLKGKIADKSARLCIIGMGYVGLPTAVFFAEKGFNVAGCDVKEDFVKAINEGLSPLEDLNLGARVSKVVKEGKLKATIATEEAVAKSDIIIIIVPTPTKEGFEPDLSYIISAGDATAKGLNRGQLVILESTVYPGVTEEELRPVLEQSGLRAGVDFGLAYCPERYNPGDPKHTIDKVTRIVGGLGEGWSEVASMLYGSITKTVPVGSIKTAEMAKIIENTQRDLNIALMNEVAIICEHMELDVMEVIKAAATKWNFHVYMPGAGVGGHCLPKDPWYLVKAAEKHGYHAKVITAGREVNDYMPEHVFNLLLRGLNSIGKPINGSKIAILGVSYKENIGDIRNSPSLYLIKRIKEMGGKIYSVDKYIGEGDIKEMCVEEHFSEIINLPKIDAIIFMTGHQNFFNGGIDEIFIKNKKIVFIDGRRKFNEDKIIKLGGKYVGLGKKMSL